MQVHILIDAPDYEFATLVAAFSKKDKAENYKLKLQGQMTDWLTRQRKLEAEGSDKAWMSDRPHSFEDLRVESMEVEE